MTEAKPARMRTLIADDEPLARERLRMLRGLGRLARDRRRSSDGITAVTTIQKLRPDLVFLDVEMPGATGFEVIEAIGAERMPFVVFVTAYDKYALKAFDVHAVDYLLKPFDRERFHQALARARQQLERRTTGELERRLLELVQDLRPATRSSNASSSSPAAGCSSYGPRRSTGSRPRATTSSCTSAPTRTCSAKR